MLLLLLLMLEELASPARDMEKYRYDGWVCPGKDGRELLPWMTAWVWVGAEVKEMRETRPLCSRLGGWYIATVASDGVWAADETRAGRDEAAGVQSGADGSGREDEKGWGQERRCRDQRHGVGLEETSGKRCALALLTVGGDCSACKQAGEGERGERERERGGQRCNAKCKCHATNGMEWGKGWVVTNAVGRLCWLAGLC